MITRDKMVLNSLEQFRVLDRDQIVALHFKELKFPIDSCNRVLKRLRDRQYIDCVTDFRPYTYFPKPSTIKKDSTKIPHFKRIADIFIEANNSGKISDYVVEFKTDKKGSVEPDLFMMWNNIPLFVEVQRTVYSQKVMEAKMDLYVKYYNEGGWKNERWNVGREKKVFPYVLIISERRYPMEGKKVIQVLQASSFDEFIGKYVKK